jgi:hypothetical protein
MTLETPVQLRAALIQGSGLAAGRQRDVSPMVVTAGPAGSCGRPNAGRDYISCHDKRLDRFLVGLRKWILLANAGGSTWYGGFRYSLSRRLERGARETLVNTCRQSGRPGRMQEELRVICGFRVAPLTGAVAQVGRATERFSNDRRRRPGYEL